jgi:hypothetical protein
MSFGRWQSIAGKEKSSNEFPEATAGQSQLTFANWILPSPIAVGQAVSGAVSNQISSLGAREHSFLPDQPLSGIDDEMLVDIWNWARDFDTDWRVVSPRSILRAQSPRDPVELEVREALIERGSAVVSRICRQHDRSVGDRRRILTVDICREEIFSQKSQWINGSIGTHRHTRGFVRPTRPTLRR